MSEIHPDPNLRVTAAIQEPDVKLYDVRKPPFSIYGLYNPLTEPQFKRMPDDVAKATNAGVAKLYLDTAGGRVRFSTDSRYVAIRAEMPQVVKSERGHARRFNILRKSCRYIVRRQRDNAVRRFSVGNRVGDELRDRNGSGAVCGFCLFDDPSVFRRMNHCFIDRDGGPVNVAVSQRANFRTAGGNKSAQQNRDFD